MDTPAQQLSKAFELRKEKLPGEALEMYKYLAAKPEVMFGEWDWWGFAQCYNDLKHYSEALEVCRAAYKKIPASDLIKKQYAQGIFYTQLAGNKEPQNDAVFLKAVEAMLMLSPPGGAFNFTAKAIFKWIKRLSTKPKIDWQEIGRWLAKMDVHTLNPDSFTIKGGPGKRDLELASEVEEWYSWQSKYLLQTQQWQACIDLCDESHKKINKWHYSNDIWFLRRKAAALMQLGRKDEAETLISEMLIRKQEWFFYYDLAQLKDTADEKIPLLAKGLIMRGDADKKVKLIHELGQLLHEKNKTKESHALALYELSLRQQADWPIAPELEQLLAQTGGIPGSIQPPEMYRSAAENAIGEFLEPKQSGTIEKLMDNGLIGFIKPEKKGESIFFRTKQFRGDRNLLRTGQSVLYEVRNSFDKKKNKPSVEAVDIEIKR